MRQILVFVEGARTEDGYFKHWGRLCRDNVLVQIDEFTGADPFSLVQRAVETQKQELMDERRGRGAAHGEIWCVFDVDAHPKLAEAIQLAERNDIKLAVSHPCFELWFVLHFQDQTGHIERRAAQRLSKQLLGCGKALNTQALDELVARYPDAVKRAKYLDGLHDGNGSPPRSNPSSETWKLVERIKDLRAS
jgi:RloB-like protein